MPVYDDLDDEWKQMVKKNGVCDPFEKSIREIEEAFKKIEDTMRKINCEERSDN